MREALYYRQIQDNTVQCELCPHHCVIKDGNYGNCKVRINSQGKLYSENYALVTALNLDPIEKKPLYHFYPAKEILSVGSTGCNLHCRFCQNFEISQSGAVRFRRELHYPSEIVDRATVQPNNIGIAFTYNEPTVFFEFMIETARLSKSAGLKNVMVSNGYINPEPLAELIEVIDAFNIDLKGFTEKFYREVAGGSLKPVLETLKFIKSHGKHLEITHLVVPGLNDEISVFQNMLDWICTELGKDTVLHISRYFPHYHYHLPPTPQKTLSEFYNTAKEKINHVYLGNVAGNKGQNTTCPRCFTEVIERYGYQTLIKNLDNKGKCSNCDTPVVVMGDNS